jgi:hypothetical protein
VIVREVVARISRKEATLHDADLAEVVSTLSTPEVTTFIRDLVASHCTTSSSGSTVTALVTCAVSVGRALTPNE